MRYNFFLNTWVKQESSYSSSLKNTHTSTVTQTTNDDGHHHLLLPFMFPKSGNADTEKNTLVSCSKKERKRSTSTIE